MPPTASLRRRIADAVDVWQADLTIRHRSLRVLVTAVALMRHRRYSPRVAWQMARQAR